jgi:sugar O-acyltransferase (sialic acid O-acetyltransferase NeuD family)
VPDLVIFGIGSLGRLARHYFDADSEYAVRAFTVDGVEAETEHDGLPLVSFDDLPNRYPPSEFELFVAVGYRQVNRGRAEVYRRALDRGYRLVTYVSSSAIVSPAATVGCNCFLFEGVIVQPFVSIGNDTVIWSGATVAHDTVVGDHCFLAPAASVSGNVVVGDYSFIGNNATVRDGVRLGEASVVGAGAVVKWDVPAGAILRAAGTQPLGDRSSADLDVL